MAETPAKLRNCIYPFPVYEAHFDSGRVLRMSFWTPGNKPIDPERGRRLCSLSEEDYGKLVDGFVEHDALGKPWWRARDPHFSGETTAPAKPRVTVKEARQVMARLLRVIEGASDADAIDRARQLIAA